MDTTGIESVIKADEQTPPPESAVSPRDGRTHCTVQDDLENRKVNLGVRYFNYRGFMNRMHNDNWDHTIECLLTSSIPRDEIDEERNRRKKFNYWEDLKFGKHAHSELPLIAENPNEIGENRYLFRVKIRSSGILHHLGELSGWGSDIRSREVLVFCRPFHVFFFYQDGMKEILKKMELEQEHINQTDFVSEHLSALVTALQEMKCYVNFVERSIMPLWAQFDRFDESTPKKVRYEEIPMLFRAGELAFVPSSKTISKVYHQSAIQNVFRMYFCSPLETYYRHGSDRWETPSERTFWALYCLDHDGEGLRTLWKTVKFDYFSGERDIISLECFPVKFHPRYDQILEQQIERGKAFRKLAQPGVSHLYYSGWNLVTGVAEQVESRIEEPEHIESEVIIDIKEAERHISEWANTEVPEITSFKASFRTEQNTIKHTVWASKEFVQGIQCLGISDHELIQDSPTYFKKATEYNLENPGIQNDGSLSKELTDEDFALLPRRICGYVLRERKFARLDVQSFQHKAISEVTLDDIQIQVGHKKIIRSSVSSHFIKSFQSKNGFHLHGPDIIRGKGRGLVILLHGAPGVGKTATAEAVALEFKKPLFPITCGDLGITPGAVEKTLKNIFRYAHLWDCILLLDEADVFLTHRDRINLERNALVSVFLRVLEYYSGILFLTTNRVGALDEALRSRAHLSLYYPHLSYEDTIAILQKNMDRLPRAESKTESATSMSTYLQVMDSQIIQYVQREYHEYHRTHRRGPWNGRQIRNAVQIAACLALFEHKDGPKNLPAVLTAEHFRTVHATMTEFDTYMTKAQRADYSKMAHMAGDRFDSYGDNLESHQPVEYQGFADSGGRQFTPMRSAGCETVSTNLRGGPAQGQGFRQYPGPGPSRGKHPGTPYVAAQRQVPYRALARFNEPLIEEDDKETFQTNFGRQKSATIPQGNRRNHPLPRAMPMEESPEEQTSDYEMHSSEDHHHLELEMRTTSKGYQTDPVFDQSLEPINNPRSGSAARMSVGHVNTKAGFQRQGYGV